MNIYFVRHGQSEGNLKNLHQDESVPLSENGIKQAKRLAKRLKNKKIDVIYASPYIRAKQTAEIISKELRLPIEYWKELRERTRPSEIYGLRLDNPFVLKIDKKLSNNFHKPDFKYSDDESFNDLLKRARKVKAHLFKHHQNQNVLCVSHGGIMKLIVLSIILGDKLTPEVFWQFYYHSWTANTGITQLEYSEKYGWTLITWNDTTHL